MKNIKSVVKNKEWQTLRKSMSGTWHSQANANKNLNKLKTYLGNTTNEDKLRRVHNYLAALRGSKLSGIKQMREQVKQKRYKLF
jgi:hypothetical protein